MQALGLDYASIDYSYTKQGQPIVWEVNVTPHWGDLSASSPSVQQAFQKITFEVLQLIYKTAGLDLPQEVSEDRRPLAA